MRRCGTGYAPTPRTIRAAVSGRPITTPAVRGGRQSQEDSTALARRGAAGSAAAPAQTPRHLDGGHRDRRWAQRVWAVDFQFDVTTDGRPIKIVSIIDEHTRECLERSG